MNKGFFLILIFLWLVVLVAMTPDYFWPVCGSTRQYDIGTIDEEFGISREGFLKVTKEAEKMWEDATGLDLFEFREWAPFKISAVFSEEQQKTKDWDESEYTRTNIKTDIDEWTEKYEDKIAEYEAKKENYEKEVARYNRIVEEWNQKWGAPASEIDRLKSWKTQLDREVERMNLLANDVNQLAQENSERVNAYNDHISVQNSIWNGEEFSKGVYNGYGIKIFQFEDSQDLRKLIAHELGHALHIDHTHDPVSVMHSHALSENTHLTHITEADLELLEIQCDTHPVIYGMAHVRRELRATWFMLFPEN